MIKTNWYKICVLLFLIFFSCQNKKKEIKTVALNIKEQKVINRTWKQFKFEPICKITSDSIFNPISIKVDNSEDIYIYDLPKQKIKQVSTSGKLVEYGEGMGKGPKEFINLTDFFIDDNYIYIVDPNLSKVVVFHKNGKFIKDYELKKIRPYRIVACKNRFFIRPVNLNNKLLILLNENFMKISEISDFFINIDPVRRSILFDGKMCTDGKDKIYYGFLYTGIILKYSINTHKYDYVYTIDKTPLPKVKTFYGGKGIRAPKKSPKPCIDLFYDNKNIYVLNNTFKKNEPILDVYDPDLNYKFSIKLPFKTYFLKIKNKKLFAIMNKGEIFIWRMLAY